MDYLFVPFMYFNLVKITCFVVSLLISLWCVRKIKRTPKNITYSVISIILACCFFGQLLLKLIVYFYLFKSILSVLLIISLLTLPFILEKIIVSNIVSNTGLTKSQKIIGAISSISLLFCIVMGYHYNPALNNTIYMVYNSNVVINQEKSVIEYFEAYKPVVQYTVMKEIPHLLPMTISIKNGQLQEKANNMYALLLISCEPTAFVTNSYAVTTEYNTAMLIYKNDLSAIEIDCSHLHRVYLSNKYYEYHDTSTQYIQKVVNFAIDQLIQNLAE